MDIVSIIGDAVADDDLFATAHAVGRMAAEHGFTVCTGGLGGVMEAALKGAKSVDGCTIGIIPGYDKHDANDFCDIVIPTGMGHARNVLVASTGIMIFSVGGKDGTASELALSRKLGKFILSYKSPLPHPNAFDTREEFLKACTQAMEH